MKKLLKPAKTALRRMAPNFYQSARAAKDRKVLQAVQKRLGLSVAAGPFVGMQYIAEATGSSLPPKLLGSYEAELHPALEHARQSRYDAVVDVGCAEGYYAVGLARMLPGTPVLAYDTDPHAQYLCRQLAAHNGVSGQVQVLGTCGPSELLARTGQRLLVVCDCEGYERDLFGTDVAQAMAASDLIIELHEPNRPGLTEYLLSVFKDTHVQRLIPLGPRCPRNFPITRKLPFIYRRPALDELRFKDEQDWLWLRPKAMAVGQYYQ